MKNILWFFLFFNFVVLPQEAKCQEKPSRGLFISVMQDPPVLSNRESISELVLFAKKHQIQTLFVQIYRENKAWFKSDVGDSGPYKESLKNLSEDAFTILIREAQAQGIQVHAWINLLSLGANQEAPLLKKYGTSILTTNRENKKTLQEFKVDNQFFLEPGDPRVKKELTRLVAEVVGSYPRLDGIQFDYIRYPDWQPDYGYTQSNRLRFQKETGILKIEKEDPRWKKWKYDQVTGLVKRLAREARRINPRIQVSTTGLVPYSRASLESFQDWSFWVKSGLIDFVTLMAYTDSESGFQKYMADAKNDRGDLKKISIAVGAYKLLNSPKVFAEQFEACEEMENRACVIFHYASLVQNPELAEAL